MAVGNVRDELPPAVKGAGVNRFVGFYWTLPVYWAGFQWLPPNAEAAAAKSRTIRYQLEQVRKYVAMHGGRLVREVVFLELQPDRSSDAVGEVLDKVEELHGDARAELAYVDFAARLHWRRHAYLKQYMESRGIRGFPVLPEEIRINGKPFDPIKHFDESRRKQNAKAASIRIACFEELTSLAQALHGRDGDYQRISEELNARAVQNIRGRSWTAEMVRKAMKRQNISFAGS